MGCVSKGKGTVMMLCQERVLRIAKLRARSLLSSHCKCLKLPIHILLPVQDGKTEIVYNHKNVF